MPSELSKEEEDFLEFAGQWRLELAKNWEERCESYRQYQRQYPIRSFIEELQTSYHLANAKGFMICWYLELLVPISFFGLVIFCVYLTVH